MSRLTILQHTYNLLTTLGTHVNTLFSTSEKCSFGILLVVFLKTIKEHKWFRILLYPHLHFWEKMKGTHLNFQTTAYWIRLVTKNGGGKLVIGCFKQICVYLLYIYKLVSMKQKLRHKIYRGNQLGKPQTLLLTTKHFFYKLQMLEDVFFLLWSAPTD